MLRKAGGILQFLQSPVRLRRLADARRMMEAGANALLVGTALMGRPEERLAWFIGEDPSAGPIKLSPA